MRILIGLFLMAFMILNAGCSLHSIYGDTGTEWSLRVMPVTEAKSNYSFDSRAITFGRRPEIKATEEGGS